MSVCGPSLFGQGNNQHIKLGNAEFIAIEAASIFDRLNLSDMRAPYKQLLKGRIILKAGQVNYLLNHLGMGDNATFLALKASYDQKSVNPDNNYVIYSYYDYPIKTFSLAQMLVLTGNPTNRIPQLYLSNPNANYPVVLDVMIGIIDDNYSFFNDDLNQNATTFTGLEYTDIKSFVVGESIVIYDKDQPPRALVYLSLFSINSIEIQGDFLIIDDESFGTIFLHFLTPYDARQAHSLLNYVLEYPLVDIDTISPLADDIDPGLYFLSTAGASGSYIVNYTGLTSGVPYNTAVDGFTYSTSISLLAGGSASVIYKENLRTLLIDEIYDTRDGTMSIMDSEMIISGTQGIVNSISLPGTYSLTFNLQDLAGNGLEGVNVTLGIIL